MKQIRMFLTLLAQTFRLFLKEGTHIAKRVAIWFAKVVKSSTQFGLEWKNLWLERTKRATQSLRLEKN